MHVKLVLIAFSITRLYCLWAYLCSVGSRFCRQQHRRALRLVIKFLLCTTQYRNSTGTVQWAVWVWVPHYSKSIIGGSQGSYPPSPIPWHATLSTLAWHMASYTMPHYTRWIWIKHWHTVWLSWGSWSLFEWVYPIQSNLCCGNCIAIARFYLNCL